MSALVAFGVTGLVACRSNPPTAESIEPSLDFTEAITIRPGFERSGPEVVVKIELADGFHVYSTGETIGRPLDIGVDDGDWVPRSSANYPKGKVKDTSLGRSVVVEGEAEVNLPVRATVDSPGPVRGFLKYQVCTETSCDRPRKFKFEIPTS